MKKTALTHIHEALGAKMIPFAGYLMPVQYEGLTVEHHTVRKEVGMFDVSHMGEFMVRGKGAMDLIQYISSNDASKLTPGKVQYACMPNQIGGIVDDLLIYCIDAETYMLVVNASNIEKDWNWIQSNNRFEATLEDLSEQTSLLAIQGPMATAALQSLTEVNLAEMGYYTFQYGTFAGLENILISATGYTGAGGFEIYMPNQHAEAIWNAIMDAGKDYGLKPIGLGARDTLRLEKAFCLYGNDINDETSPLEAGLGWITKFTKDFVNSQALKAQKEAGVTKKLVGFELVDKGIPRHDYEIANDAGEIIGKVTSGTMSPSLGKAIGLGYVPVDFASPGSEIAVMIRGKALKAVVVKTPFL
jgi:aminomethyltransferase